MKLNTLHKDLKKIYKGQQTRYNLGFDIEAEDEIQQIIKLYKKGFWSVLPFGFWNGEVTGLKLSPKTSIKEMPVVQFNPVYESCKTYAPCLGKVVPFYHLSLMDEVALIDKTKEEIDSIIEACKPLEEYTGEKNTLEYLKNYLFDPENQTYFAKAEKKHHIFYLEFWKHYYNTPQQDAFFETIHALIKDKKSIPSFEKKDYGLWNAMVYNSLAERAESFYSIDIEKSWEYIWNSAIQTHGFDAIKGAIWYETSFNKSSSSLNSIADNFNSENYAHLYPKEIANHPLFHAMEAIQIHGTYGYSGREHLIAAAILEEEYKDPIAAWDAMVSASYWAGANHPEIVGTIWEAAIFLCDKNNWTELKEVLEQQLTFFNKHKDKV